MKVKFPKGSIRSVEILDELMAQNVPVYAVVPTNGPGPHRVYEVNRTGVSFDKQKIADWAMYGTSYIPCKDYHFLADGFLFTNYWFAYAYAQRIKVLLSC
jgi:hypothetical protein